MNRDIRRGANPHADPAARDIENGERQLEFRHDDLFAPFSGQDQHRLGSVLGTAGADFILPCHFAPFLIALVLGCEDLASVGKAYTGA